MGMLVLLTELCHSKIHTWKTSSPAWLYLDIGAIGGNKG